MPVGSDGLATLQVPPSTVYWPPTLVGCTAAPAPKSKIWQPLSRSWLTLVLLLQLAALLSMIMPLHLPPLTSLQPQAEQPRVSVMLSYKGSFGLGYSAGHSGGVCPSAIPFATQRCVT